MQALPNGITLTDTITVTSEDGSASQVITITITGTNGVATIAGAVSGGVVEDTTLTVSGVLTVADEDTGEAELVPIAAGTPGANSYGTFEVLANGNWTYTLDNTLAAVQALPNGITLTDTITVTSEDGTASQVITITVTGVNEIPTVTTMAAPVDAVAEDTQVEITFADIAAQGDEADADGTVTAFVVKGVTTGTLLIGTTAGTATAFVAGVNDTIDATRSAFWTGASDANGTLNAFTVVAQDDVGAESALPAVQVQVTVNDVNEIPTVTTMAAPVDAVAEDTQVEITFADIAAQGDEADVDGTVTAFVVKGVTTGTLLIGTTAGTATAFVAGVNDTIDATRSAFWTGASNANGTLNAFTVVAKDDVGAESALPAVQVQVTVTGVNDIPTVTTMAAPVDAVAEDTQVEITFADIAAQGDEADVDGTVTAFVVKGVTTGTLLIGTTAGTATAFVAGVNDTIDATRSAFWTGASNANGTLNAFTVVAQDNVGAESALPAVQVQVTVNDVNEIPTVTTMAAPVDAVAEDTQVEITFADIAAQGDEADVDGTVTAFVVKGVTTGTLLIGTTAGTATAFVAGVNDTIDATRSAFWTGASDANGTLNAFTVVAQDDVGAESALPAVQVQVTVNDVNEIPTVTTMAAPVDAVAEDTQVEITFADIAAQGDEADADGTVTAFVVKGVTTGTLLIGTTAGTATAFVAGVNDTIDATRSAFWTGASNANGTLNAFTVVAQDDVGAESALPAVQVQVTVNDVNEIPTVTTMAAPVDAVAEDTQVEITFADIAAQGDEADADGTVTAFVVKGVTTGTLLIGTTAGTATAFVAGVNDTIDATRSAFWTGASDANGTLNAFTVVAQDDVGAEFALPAVQVQVTRSTRRVT